MRATIGGWCGVITDATSTIGRAVAVELGRDCVRVAIGYRGYRGADFEAAERIVREVVAVGGEAIPLRLPVDSEVELERVIGGLAEHWGRLDFVVDLDNQCLFGKAALPWMLERSKGRLVHISAAGAAAISFTRRDIAQVAARGVAINSIRLAAPCPAPPAKPEDVATTVYFLLAQSACMTGQVIDLSGARPSACGRRRTRPTRSICAENHPRGWCFVVVRG